MDPWNCCRACLGVEALHPIFQVIEHHEKYTDVIYSATGLKVEFNDALPQKMCTSCINFINTCYKFRKKCEENQKSLISRLDEKPQYEIKIETNIFNIESNGNISIDISDLTNYLNEHDDTLNSYDYNITDNIENNDVEFETKVEDLVDKPVELIFKSKKSKNGTEKPVKRSLRRKKETGETKQRCKEEIECEYCHKILTSKLSLRNHYKIHTGFDIVCEHCGKKFITRRLLLMHCRAKHGYEKTDKCSFCDYKASNAEQVKIHERLHTGEKPFVCAECGAGFHRKSSYLQHVAIHLPDKNVQCDQCPARFKSVTLMRIHKNRHRAATHAFRCGVCDNTFVRRRNVLRHLVRIHSLPPDPHNVCRVDITK